MKVIVFAIRWFHFRRVINAYILYRQLGMPFVLQLVKQCIHDLNPPRNNHKTRLPETDAFTPFAVEFYDNPKVTIVIPVYNKFEYTYACIRSLYIHTKIPYEIIVIDDGSTDATSHIDRYISGIRLYKNSENLGYLLSCNKGAELARGEYLLLLNNDTQVTTGWLEAMLSPFQGFPDVGVVGAKLLYPNGQLQEAGGLIWSDGSGCNFGRLDDPEKPEYNYVRDVDYCSGACIVLSKPLWETLGGFDSRFIPAYYEDTDLAFSVRAIGKRVLYQPFAEIVHFEGITSGLDLNAGAKKYQKINRETFVDKWRATLESYGGVSDLLRYRDRYAKKRVIVIDADTPTPDRDSGSLRMTRILQLLVKMGCKVTFIPDNLLYNARYSPALRASGIETLNGPYVPSIKGYFKKYGALADAVILSRRNVAEAHFADARRYCPKAKIIFDTVDLHFIRETREQSLRQDHHSDLWCQESLKRELTLARHSDEVWVVSDIEKQILADISPELNVRVVSNVHNLELTNASFASREGILFIGGFRHAPNVDAVTFYLNEIHERVCSLLGPISVSIVGGDAPQELVRLARKFNDVEMLGFVDDLQPYHSKVRLSIAPLRYGAGVKGKINTSMSCGVPVVTTSIGAEGMHLSHRESAMIADTPEAFAEAIAELYNNEELWRTLVHEGAKNINERFSMTLAEQELRNALM